MSNRKSQLKELVGRFESFYNSGNFDESAEASARTWIEKFLEIFEWDVSNPIEIGQENSISSDASKKMHEIESTHKTPDYSFHLGDNLLAYLDAKKTNIQLSTCKKSSFQIRSYGWSAGLNCCFITNFKELAIYDTRYKPDKNDNSDVARMHYFSFENYIENFDVIEKLLLKKNVQNRVLDEIFEGKDATGTKTLDQDFAENLGLWRLEFSKQAYKSNPKLEIDFIAEQVQLILDRVVFLRVAEGKKIETHSFLEKLSEKKDSFKLFKNLCEKSYSSKYGGFLFTNKNKIKIEISDTTFSSFIKTLYYPFPYRFEVIPTELLGNMYELYLGKKIQISKGKVVDDFKEEYQKTKGAVYTPRYIVDSICKSTLSEVVKNKSMRSILNLNVIDPSCGSGSFLLGIFDHLESELISIINNQKNLEKKYDSWYWKDIRTNKTHLRVNAKRHLINSCIYGVDIDEQAAEVARLSLALKALEGIENEPEIFELKMKEPNILSSIGENVKVGNSLVCSKILTIFPELTTKKHEKDLLDLKIFDWESEDGFKKVFDERGGFDAVVGNPPYIETKHYKDKMPFLNKLLSLTKNRYYNTAAGGKLDIAMPFIERGYTKLNENGKLGYIVTNRFFKTDYGKATREYLSERRCVEKIIDFGEQKIFKGRSTYTAILLISKEPALEKVKYKKINTLKNIQYELLDIIKNKKNWNEFSYDVIDSGLWNFEFPDLLELKESLLNRFPSFEKTKELEIKVGLQVLWDKVYHLKPIRVSRNKLLATNGLGKQVEIELDICKPTLCNDSFYAFRDSTPDIYVIFPYEQIEKMVNGKKALVEKDITMTEIKTRYPLAYKYLKSVENTLKENVEYVDDEKNEQWHLYTRKQNIFSQAVPKMLFPTTITDTVACVDELGSLYQDNARVFSIITKGANLDFYWALGSVFNSTLFNCLAKTTTNPLQEGHVQFNKQFVEPLPFPFAKLDYGKSQIAQDLATIGKDIFALLTRIKEENSESKRKSLILSCKKKFTDLDLLVENVFYSLNASEKATLTKYPRKLDRVEYYQKFLEDVA